jgi:hypothetical protein
VAVPCIYIDDAWNHLPPPHSYPLPLPQRHFIRCLVPADGSLAARSSLPPSTDPGYIQCQTSPHLILHLHRPSPLGRTQRARRTRLSTTATHPTRCPTSTSTWVPPATLPRISSTSHAQSHLHLARQSRLVPPNRSRRGHLLSIADSLPTSASSSSMQS